MDFTFGIITDGKDAGRVSKVIASIYMQDIPNFEIIVIGGTHPYKNIPEILYYPFDESEKPNWITKKKNNITTLAKYENIVYLHDYVVLKSFWYKNMVEFGDRWDVCMTRIENKDGTRYRDWVYWDAPFCRYGVLGKHQLYLAPYDATDTKHMYISGAYWIAKKLFMEQHSLDENKVWGDGEDVDWSIRTRKKGRWVMNSDAAVRLLKQKNVVAIPMKGRQNA